MQKEGVMIKMKANSDLFFLSQQEIQNATNESYRQYFVGNLARPQLLQHLHSEDLEIGMSVYRTFTADKPHMHTTTADMVYILSGEYHILLIETHQIIVMRTGDFLSIPLNTPYASKAKAGTKVLFIKTCKGNDKVTIPIPDNIQQWMDTII